jgi:hypothetical protein
VGGLDAETSLFPATKQKTLTARPRCLISAARARVAGALHNEVICFEKSPRLLTVMAINQLRAPGTNRVEAHAKLGFAFDVHAQKAIELHSERWHAHRRRIQRAKTYP